LGIWRQRDGSETAWCIRCDWTEHSATTLRTHPAVSKSEPRPDHSRLAASLWARRKPLEGTPAEIYLRVGRGIGCALPPTLGYLPAHAGYAHAMIAAFGLCDEIAPGLLGPPEAVTAIHLTELAIDGHARTSKRMLGPVSGQPLVLAPPNDGLGLVIAEGIEDALSLHEATGLGAWAGGSAGHMAKLGLAVPDYIDCVSIAEDANAAGSHATRTLSDALKARGITCQILKL
jgi:hypothetical protein